MLLRTQSYGNVVHPQASFKEAWNHVVRYVDPAFAVDGPVNRPTPVEVCSAHALKLKLEDNVSTNTMVNGCQSGLTWALPPLGCKISESFAAIIKFLYSAIY